MRDESAIRDKAREAIRAGRIPSRNPERTWGGPGIGASCAICCKPVTREDVEFELEFSGDTEGTTSVSYHVHVRCFAAWEFERQGFQSGSHPPTHGQRPDPGADAEGAGDSGT